MCHWEMSPLAFCTFLVVVNALYRPINFEHKLLFSGMVEWEHACMGGSMAKMVPLASLGVDDPCVDSDRDVVAEAQQWRSKGNSIPPDNPHDNLGKLLLRHGSCTP